MMLYEIKEVVHNGRGIVPKVVTRESTAKLNEVADLVGSLIGKGVSYKNVGVYDLDANRWIQMPEALRHTGSPGR